MANEEQIVQKMRHSYNNSTIGEWKLTKNQEGQLKITKDDMVVAIVDRLEDAVFIENAHKLLPGIMNVARGTVAMTGNVAIRQTVDVKPVTTPKPVMVQEVAKPVINPVVEPVKEHKERKKRGHKQEIVPPVVSQPAKPVQATKPILPIVNSITPIAPLGPVPKGGILEVAP